MRRLLLTALLLLLAFPAAAGAQIRLQKVGDFNIPLYLTAAPGDYSRLYVVEKDGAIRVHRGGATVAEPFLTLTEAELLNGSERGLLSMAFRPDFKTSRLLYIYYTDADGDVRVDELRATDPDRADAGYRRKVIEIEHSAQNNHNGGTLMFGPDAHLYLAPGDGGSDLSANAQNTDSLLGKVLRIDPTPGGGYTVPADNPFVGRAGADEVWSYGLRNPFRFTVDPVTGDLAIGDVGAGTTEEIDYAPATQGAGRGVNFGWNTCEGSFLMGSKTSPCTLGTLPVIDHFRTENWRSIVAGYVVRDPSLPSLAGRFVHGDVTNGQIWSAQLALPKAQDDKRLLDLPGVVSFGRDAGGCLYATSVEGPVYRLVERTTEVPCAGPVGPAGGGGGEPVTVTVDSKAPRLRTRVSRRQRVLKQRGAIGYSRCNEACRVSMSGVVRIGRRSYKLKKVTLPARANRRLKLRIRLTKRSSRAIRSALKRKRRAYVKVALRARDGSRNRSRLARATVRVKR